MVDLVERLHVTPEQIAQFCKRHHIVRLSFFGSVVRADFRPDSDVDVLVRLSDNLPPTFSAYDIFGLRDELSELFGRDVDLVEEGATRNPFRKKRIMETRQVIYEEAV